MKKISKLIIISILILNTTAFGELTQSDLEKIDGLIKASEERIKLYVDLKIDALDKKLTGDINALDKKLTGDINVVREEIKALDTKLTGQIESLGNKLTGEIKGVGGRVTQIFGFVIALVALIAVAIGLPQILLARRGKEMQEYMDQVKALKEEVESLKQQLTVGS